MWFKLSCFALILSFWFASADTDKKVVCYHGSWSVYRNGKGKFTIEDINPHLCTHLIYGFVGLNETDGNITVLDPWIDIDNGGFERFNALREQNPNLKTLVAIGGWNEGSIKYSKFASTRYNRRRFVNNAVSFIKAHGFDGFDLDWEYPAQRGGVPEDKDNFGLLLKEFRSAFDKHGYLLTAAVGATAKAINISYHVPILAENLDFINVMAYDLHGYFDGYLGENAPLYASYKDVTEDAKMLNVDACIQAWIDNGAPPEKLVLGMGTYGRTFTLTNPWITEIGTPANRPGNVGPYTGESGMLGYNEICESQLDGNWTVVWNEDQKVPYAYFGDQWVGYDNPQSIALKVNYANKMNLGGVMIWSIETDDFLGVCGPAYPILSTINSVIRRN